ncbi:MAG: hypothetical protein ACJZ68_03700, partial [Limisphaerales bacterium]
MNVKIVGTVLGGLIIAAGAQDNPDPAPLQQDPAVGLRDLKPVRSADAAQVTRSVAPEKQKKQSDQEDRLKLLGGGSLDGKFLGFHEGRVRWANSAFGAPVSVDAGAVDSVRVKQPALPLKVADCRVTLVTGENVIGSLKSLNEQALVLETWYAGELTIPRRAIQLVEPRR